MRPQYKGISYFYEKCPKYYLIYRLNTSFYLENEDKGNITLVSFTQYHIPFNKGKMEIGALFH